MYNLIMDHGGRKSMKKRISPQDKVGIVLEFLNTDISVVELCRKHNISPPIFYQWNDKFVQTGKLVFTNKQPDCTKLQKEIDNLNRIIGKYAVANDVLKKT